jgi:hypothetical protein
MNSNNTEKHKSFAEILLEGVQKPKSETKHKALLTFIYAAIAFLLYAFMFYVGYDVISRVFKTPTLSLLDCIKIWLGIIAIKTFIFPKF